MLEAEHLLDEFLGRIQREWAIETGILERVYSLDRGVTETLIKRGIDAALIPHESTDRDPAWVAQILQDHVDSLEMVFAFVKGERELTAGFTKELHAALLRHQDTHLVRGADGRLFDAELAKGAYKTLPNNPTRPDGAVHEYCPPEHVASEMDRLVEFHGQHQDAQVPPEVEAAWLHHAFTQIHPFADGNGRVARALSTLVFLRSRWFPLVISRDQRAEYIEALETADKGDLRPLVTLFAESQRYALEKAVNIVFEVREPRTVEEAVAAAREKLALGGTIEPPAWQRSRETADELYQYVDHQLQELARQLTEQIGRAKADYVFSVNKGGGREYPQVVAVANRLGYTADLGATHKYKVLRLQTDSESRLYVSFHGFGARFRGLIAVSAFFETDTSEPQPVADSYFQINYREPAADARKRFTPWLEKALIRGLSLWRARL